MPITQEQEIELSSTAANIPLVAAQAANELDELIEGRASSFNAVKGLADILKKSFRLDAAFERQSSFIDSGSVAVFAQAFDEVSAGHEISSVDDLIKRAVEIVKSLEKSSSDGEHGGVKALRDFCIALSNAAAAYQQSVYDMRPSHPFQA